MEYKSRISITQAEAAAERIGDYQGELAQADIYFKPPQGRLKLREITESSPERVERAELIYYERPESAAARFSLYQVVPVADPQALSTLLAAALGVRGQVRKTRRVWIWNACRIHLDRVDGLGEFIEFEALSQGDAPGDYARMATLLRAFDLTDKEAIHASYADLLGF